MDPKPTQRLDIDALRALIAIEEHGGVTRAAEHLGLSQSAVSHKIRRLETNLDCALLSRRPGAPLFSDAGIELLAYARRIITIHDEALNNLSKTPVQGNISLGMTEDTTCTDLARFVGRFTRLHPGVIVRTQVRQSLTLQQLLKSGDIDVAVMQVFEHEVRPTDTVLFREGLHWVKSPDLQLKPNAPIPFLSFDENCFYRHWAMDVAQDRDNVFQVVLDCSSAAGIVAAVQSGLGVAVLNERHITKEMDVIQGKFPQPPSVEYVARVGERTRAEAVFALIREIGREYDLAGALRIA